MSNALGPSLVLRPLSAQVLARLYYGLPLPEPAKRHDNRANSGVQMAVRAMLLRGLITDDHQVTEYGAQLLRRHVELKR